MHPMRRLITLAVAATLALTIAPEPARAATTATLVVPCTDGPDCWPAAFTFTPKGQSIFYVERYSGEIHRVNVGTGANTMWGDVIEPEGSGERGALGIAVDPRWDRKAKTKKAKRKRRRQRWVYVFYTHAGPVENRIIRVRKTKKGNFIVQPLLVIVIDSLASNHNGGVIHFGPDRKLYVVTGDQGPSKARAQDPADPAGKVLRLDRDGSRPADNPIPGSKAYSIGHRNSFGFSFDPTTGRVWQSENGPDCDELNLILPGRNYGWGAGSPGSCPMSTDGPSPVAPEKEYEPVIVPTGVAFCSGCGLGPEVEGDLLLGSYGHNEIRHLGLDGERDDVVSENVLLSHFQGVVAVERRPNGQVYFSDPDGIYRLDAV
jgi:glucose/arabinose dehydrogenase